MVRKRTKKKCVDGATSPKRKRLCIKQLKKWGMESHLDQVVVDNSHRIVCRDPNRVPLPVDYLYNLIVRELHSFWAESDTTLVVMNDVLNDGTKWHSKEKYVGVLRRFGLPLILCRSSCITNFEKDAFFEKVSQDGTRVNCRVIVPRRTTGDTRNEYILLSHPRDAQLALAAMPREENVNVLRMILVAAGNYDLIMEASAAATPPLPLQTTTPPPSPTGCGSGEVNIVQEAFNQAMCEYCAHPT